MSGTADVYTQATLSPSKLELLAPWLVQQSWFEGDAADLERVAFFRFVDPDGEVGLDSMLIASGGAIYHVPVTWRGSELEGGELIGTLEHGVLGTRWCYDATGDPVYVAELVRVIHEADNEAGLSVGRPSMTVRGSGITTVSNASMEAARLVRVLDGRHVHTAQPLGVLEGTWTQDGAERTEILATIR